MSVSAPACFRLVLLMHLLMTIPTTAARPTGMYPQCPESWTGPGCNEPVCADAAFPHTHSLVCRAGALACAPGRTGHLCGESACRLACGQAQACTGVDQCECLPLHRMNSATGECDLMPSDASSLIDVSTGSELVRWRLAQPITTGHGLLFQLRLPAASAAGSVAEILPIGPDAAWVRTCLALDRRPDPLLGDCSESIRLAVDAVADDTRAVFVLFHPVVTSTEPVRTIDAVVAVRPAASESPAGMSSRSIGLGSGVILALAAAMMIASCAVVPALIALPCCSPAPGESRRSSSRHSLSVSERAALTKRSGGGAAGHKARKATGHHRSKANARSGRRRAGRRGSVGSTERQATRRLSNASYDSSDSDGVVARRRAGTASANRRRAPTKPKRRIQNSKRR